MLIRSSLLVLVLALFAIVGASQSASAQLPEASQTEVSSEEAPELSPDEIIVCEENCIQEEELCVQSCIVHEDQAEKAECESYCSEVFEACIASCSP